MPTSMPQGTLEFSHSMFTDISTGQSDMSYEKLRVLFVEGDEDDYMIVRSLLSKASRRYEIDWVRSYEAALPAAEENSYDVYLLNHRLGDHDGLDLLKELAAKGCNCPTIILTEYEDDESDHRVMQEGAFDYLSKREINAGMLERSIRYAINRKQVEESLRESEERYRMLFNKANDAIFLLESTLEGSFGRFVEANDVACEMLGFTREELLHRSPSEIILPESKDFGEEDKKRLSAERQMLMERVLISKNGRRVPVEINIHFFKHREKPTILAIARDITERKSAELVLKESESQFRMLSHKFSALLHAMEDTLVLLSPDMKILWANSAALCAFGKEVVHPTERCCHEVVFGSSIPCDDCPATKCFRTGETESLISRREGRFLDKRAFPIREDGHVKGAVLVISDITEKMTTQAEAMQACHLASLGELAAGVAHEINNPINGVINYAQVVINEGKPGTVESDMARRILDEGCRIARIVKSLLSFARRRKERRSSHLSDIVAESLILTHAQLRKEGICLRIAVPENLPEIQINFQEIQQVFLNIINNARCALNERYPARHENKLLEIMGDQLMVNGRVFVRITFLDRGVGIPSERLSLVTKPFFSTKPFGKGTGLGLSISRQIIEDHGGELHFESIEGEFTKVTVCLPAKKEP